jgi:hypothetical protein
VEPIPNSRNFKLKKQVELTTTFTKELDSTMEEVEFWQEKYEEAMNIIRMLKRHYPQDVETLSNKGTEEFTLASPPSHMATSFPTMRMTRSRYSLIVVFSGLAPFS